MNLLSQIALLIGGTKTRDGGFVPLYNVGILQGQEYELAKMDKSTLIKEKPVYKIKHADEYILYQLIDRYVKPCDRDTFGVLSISITIAKNLQLANGASPYTLLKKVYDTFVANCMMKSEDGTDRFINKEYDKTIFENIVDKYPIEYCQRKNYVTMNPSGLIGTICVPEEKMAELFRDSQYEEFRNFKEIEIGRNCNTMPGLNIEIPRPIPYTVFVNNARYGMLTYPFDRFDTSTVLKDTVDETYNNIDFSLENILSAENHELSLNDSTVKLDKTNNRIICNVKVTKNYYHLKYEINGENEEEEKFLYEKMLDGSLSLNLNQKKLQFSFSSPREVKVLASDIDGLLYVHPNKTKYNGYDLSLDTQKRIDKEEKVITVKMKIVQRTKIPEFKPTPRTPREVGPLVPPKQANKRPSYDFEEKIEDKHDAGEEKKSGKNKLSMRLVFGGVGLLLGLLIGFGTMYYISHRETVVPPKSNMVDSNDENTIVDLKNTIASMQENIASLNDSIIQKDSIINVLRTSAKNQNKEQAVVTHGGSHEEIVQEKTITQTAARAEILKLINSKKSINECRRDKSFKVLSYEDQCAVEAVLNMDQYSGTKKTAVKKILKNKTFKSWQDLKNVQVQINNL